MGYTRTLQPGSATYAPATVVLATGTADSAAIAAAFNTMKVSGHARGTLVIKGTAAIDTALVFDGGFTDVANSSDANAVGESGRFNLVVDGVLAAASGVGTAVTIKGFRGARATLNFTGGGSSDVALDIQNLVDFDLVWLNGNQFAGTLLHADASSSTTKLVSESHIRSIHAQGCGRALYFNSINAFGRIDEVCDTESVNGSEFHTCADITLGYWESYTPATQTVGLLFDTCGNMDIDTLAMGDRPTEAIVKIIGGDVAFGRISKIRVTGQPLSTPVTTGLKLVDVGQIVVAMLTTATCAKGLHILGGGGATGGALGGSIQVLHHRSLTGDINPLYIEAGTESAQPIIYVNGHYRFHQAQSAYIASSITGGELHLSGLIDTPNSLGAGSIYAVDCLSTTMLVDVTGLEELHRTTLAGSVRSATPANIVGVTRARLADTVQHGTIVTGTTPVLGTDYQNTTGRTMNCLFRVRLQPSTTVDAELDFLMGPTNGTEASCGYILRTHQAAAAQDFTELFFFRVPPWWWFTFQNGGGTITPGSLKYWLD